MFSSDLFDLYYNVRYCHYGGFLHVFLINFASGLKALILNNNKIAQVSGLDQLVHLNTLGTFMILVCLSDYYFVC